MVYFAGEDAASKSFYKFVLTRTKLAIKVFTESFVIGNVRGSFNSQMKMYSDNQVTMEVVVLSTEGIGFLLSEKKLTACLPVLKKMLAGEWLNWRRKEINTSMSARALSVFLNYVENKSFADNEAFQSPKIVVQLLEASYKYYIPELWKDVSTKILFAKDAWFRDTTLDILDVVIRAHPRPNSKAIAKMLLEQLATKHGISWRSFEQHKFSTPCTHDHRHGCDLFTKDHVLLFIAVVHHEKLEFRVKPYTSVYDVKRRYSRTTKHPLNELRFVWMGKQLDDFKSITEYNIRRVDVIHVVFRLGPPTDCSFCLSKDREERLQRLHLKEQ